MTVSNWRAQNFHDVYGDTNYISGRNGSGKSTRIAAWLWLISGYTDANSPANSRLFDDRLELTPQTPVASVKAIVDIDGEFYTIERTAQASFSRKRGTDEYAKNASDTYKYFVDEIERSATAFKEWLNEHIAKEDMLQFVLSGEFFINKVFEDKKSARNIIERLVGKVTREEMQGDYSAIDELLAKFSLDEIDSRAQNMSKSIEQRLNEIPALIKAKEAEISEIEQTDFVSIEKEIQGLEQERTNLDKRLVDLSERIKPQMEARHQAERDKEAKQQVFDKAYDDWKRMYESRRDKLVSEINAIRQQNEKSRNAYNEAFAKQDEAATKIETLQALLRNAKAKRESLLKERDDIKAKEFDTSTAKCPFCGHQLDGDKLQEEINKFEEKKRNMVNDIVIRGKANNEDMERMERQIKDLELVLSTPLPEVINQSTEDLEKKVAELTGVNTSRLAFCETEQGRQLLDDIGSVVIPEVTMPDNSEITAAKQEVNNRLTPLYERRGLKTRAESLRRVVDELRIEQREKGSELAVYERQRHAVKEYKQEQMEILSHKVNDGLRYSSISVWSQQKDGSLVPDIVLKDAHGVSYATTNQASRIATCVDIQRFFCEKLGVMMPTWVDESSTINNDNLPKSEGSQMFFLFCSDTALKVDVK